VFRNTQTPTGIDLAIDDLLSELKGFTADTKEYATMIKQLQKLHAMKVAEKPSNVSPDTLAMIVGNLMGIVLILEFERMNVITSKAMSFVSKLR
jgi:cysteine sulfinate desulfinase/cysteine desulfurase-like protein